MSTSARALLTTGGERIGNRGYFISPAVLDNARKGSGRLLP
jgi:hypothetical protein